MAFTNENPESLKLPKQVNSVKNKFSPPPSTSVLTDILRVSGAALPVFCCSECQRWERRTTASVIEKCACHRAVENSQNNLVAS